MKPEKVEPQYRRIRDTIMNRIHSGELAPGDRVESEQELGARFGVSRLTVQRAIRELVSQGLVRRVQGSGTFVNTVAASFPLLEVRDLVQEIRNRGGEPQVEVLLQRRHVPEAEVLELLELAPGSEVFHATILLSMDSVPVAHEERFAVTDIFPDFLDQDFAKVSIFTYFARHSVLEDVENVVRAVSPSKRLAQLLEIAPDEPCLQVQRRNWYSGKAVTLTNVTYAGSRQALASRYRPANGG